jgi:L-2-hydroxyglutarate oxidase
MAILYWKMGLMEQWRSCVKSAFVRSLQRLVPSLTSDDVKRAGSGVRAQALEANGHLVDDFRIIQIPQQIHVLNAPSPAATASLSIGDRISGIAVEHFFE